MVSWDIERQDETGKIPSELYEQLVAKLKIVMKGKKIPRS